jgi:hypothetical protein
MAMLHSARRVAILQYQRVILNAAASVACYTQRTSSLSSYTSALQVYLAEICNRRGLDGRPALQEHLSTTPYPILE